MTGLTMTDAFRRYGATLANPQWAVSAIASDGSCVISCWKQYTELRDGVLRYTDRLSRWGHNTAGNNLLEKHLQKVSDENLDIRLVLVRTEQTDIVDAGGDASKVKKTFYVKDELVGRLVTFDGDEFVIEFVKQGT